jgi:OmpA-OmpF porin, OOP family
MKKLTPAGMWFALMAVSAPAFAQYFGPPPNKTYDYYEVDKKTWYISPMFDWVLDRDGRNTNDGLGGSIYGGKFFDANWAVEFGYFHHYFDNAFANGRSWRENGIEGSGLYFFNRSWPIQPFLIMSADWVHTTRPDEVEGVDTSDNTGDNFAWAAGAGLMVPFRVFGYPVGLRADARLRWLKIGSKLLVNTDGSTTANNDGDFQEPVLRAGFIIPLGVKRVAAATPAPAAAPVKAAPPPPPAAPAEEGTRFEDVNFPYNKSTLTDKARASLDADAKAIDKMVQRNPKTVVEVSGHTDWIGSDAYNQALSERRAQSVKDYLTRKGVAASRINTQAFGESKPIADNRTDEGRALNRRAEIRAH